MTRARRILLWAAATLLVPHLAQALPAFPGAEGYGSDTPGGRGGTVYVVTDLQGAGPGSLKHAVQASGPRIVVFAVSGTYVGSLVVREPYLTIAGQTAPGGGVAVYGAGHTALEIKTHDVVVRHLRLRSGPPDMPDALRIDVDAHHVVIDHCSISWGIDENLSVLGHTNTIQWSIVSEALRASTHKSGAHSMGSMLGPGDVSVHHSLYAHNNARNPRIGGRDTTVDFVNNVIYNFGSAISRLSAGGPLRINYVGNTVIEGPDSGRPPVFAIARNAPISIHAAGNRIPASLKLLAGSREHMLSPRRHAAPQVTTLDAADAYAAVLAGAGASLPARDAADARIVRSVVERSGSLVDNPRRVGGIPELASAPAPRDADRDGMPDAWERAQGLDPGDPGDAAGDLDGDGYTNVEEFINHHAPWTDDPAAGGGAPRAAGRPDTPGTSGAAP